MAGTMSLMKDSKGLGVLAIVMIVILAVLQGFQTASYPDPSNASITKYLITGTANTTATNFVSGLGQFGTFATVIALAIVGFFVIRYVSEQGE